MTRTSRRSVEPLAYSVSETAECLGVSTDSVRRLVREGELPTIPVIGRVVIPIRAIEDFLARSTFRQTVPNPQEPQLPHHFP